MNLQNKFSFKSLTLKSAKLAFKHALDLVYPPICLHCDILQDDDNHMFCPICMKLLTPIDPEERCPFCFSSTFDPLQERCCQQCRKDPLPLKKVAAVFDYEGPPASLIRHLKYGGQPYIAKGCGAYLAYQFVKLQWPIPDAIIPMPMPILRKLDRGYNQSVLIAESFAEFLDRPVHDILHKKSTGFSQAGLDVEQRKALSSSSFTIKKKHPPLHDKTILIIDDVMTTGSSLRCCAEALASLYPADIYGLTVCRTI